MGPCLWCCIQTSFTRWMIKTYPAVMLSWYWVVLVCYCCPVHPGRVDSDGHCHLHTPHSHHRCRPLEPHTRPRTLSVLADTDTQNELFWDKNMVLWGVLMCLEACVTCWDKIVTASLCLASRKLMLLTARMASPTCKPPHLSAGWLGWISEIRIGTPCSFPP